MVKAIGIRLSDNFFYPVWTPSDKKTKRTLISLDNDNMEALQEGLSLEFFESQDQEARNLSQIALLSFDNSAQEFEVFVGLEENRLYLLARSNLGEEQKIELDYLSLPQLSQWYRDLNYDNTDIHSIDAKSTDLENFSLELDKDDDFDSFLKDLNNENLSFLGNDSEGDEVDLFKDDILNDAQKEFSDQSSNLILWSENTEAFLEKNSQDNSIVNLSQKEELPWGEEKPLDIKNLIDDNDLDEELVGWDSNERVSSQQSPKDIEEELESFYLKDFSNESDLSEQSKEELEQNSLLEGFLLDDFAFTSEESLEKDIQKAVRETIRDTSKEQRFSRESEEVDNQAQEERRNQFFLTMALFPLAFFVLLLGTLFFYQNHSSLSSQSIEAYNMDWKSSQFQKNIDSWGNSKVDHHINELKTSIKKKIEKSFENLTKGS